MSATMETTLVDMDATTVLGTTEYNVSVQEDEITRVLSVYTTAAFVVVGMFGNSLSVMLLLCTKLKYQSCSHYMAAAIIANTFCLFATSLKWAAILDVELYNRSGWCQFVTFLDNTCVFLSVWCTAALALDRHLAMWCSAKARNFCSTFRAKCVIVALSLVAVVVYMNISLIMGAVETAGTSKCSPLPDYFSDMKVLRTVDIGVNFAIPYLAILAIGVGMCRFACCDTGREDDAVSDDAHLAKTTCAFLGSFLVLRLPKEILRLTHSPHFGLVESPPPSTDSTAVYYSKAFAGQLYLASLSLHLILLLLTHKGFAIFCKKSLARPAKCFKGRRRLMVQTEEGDVALDTLPPDGTRVYV